MQYEFNQKQTDYHIQIEKMLSKIQHNFIHVQRIHIKLHSSFVKLKHITTARLNHTQKSRKVKPFDRCY